MKRQYSKWLAMAAAVLFLAVSVQAATILSDDFGRTAGAAPPPAAFNWGDNNNGLGGSVTQTYLAGAGSGAGWVTDVGASLPGGHVSVGQGNLRNKAAIVDYNLATDADVLAAGGFIVQAAFKPQQGVSGREWLSVVIRSSNAATGSLYAIADKPEETATVAGMAIRNTSSVLRVGYPQGYTNPPIATEEPILDQTLFDSYVWGAALPNDNLYEVKISVASTDFSAAGSYTACYYARIIGQSWVSLGSLTGTWGTDDAAYVVLAGTRGDSGTTYTEAYFDSLKITAIPEPATFVLLGLGGLLLGRRRR